MFFLKKFFSKKADEPHQEGRPITQAPQKCKGELVFDEKKEKALLKAYSGAATETEKHFARIALSDYYYKFRHDPECKIKCVKVCEEDVDMLDALDVESELRWHTPFIGRISAFERLIEIAISDQNFEIARLYCAHAIQRCVAVGSSAELYEKKMFRIAQKEAKARR